MRRLVFAVTVGLGLLSTAAPGQAATYYFSFTGDYQADFTLDSDPSTAIYGSDFTYSLASYSRIRSVDGLFDGISTTNADLIFYTLASLGGVRIAVGSTVFSVLGPQLFTGSAASPSFNLGTYYFTEQKLPGDIHPQPVATALTISDAPLTAPVPEPATWAMMVAGFALAGGAIRRKINRRTTRMT